MNVLAIGAHADDVELGCGATLAKHIWAGDSVTVFHLSPGVGARPGDASRRIAMAYKAGEAIGGARVEVSECTDQQFDTFSLLSIVQHLERQGFTPDVVYMHHRGDLNLDHVIAARVAETAYRPKPGRVPRILAFEVLSSTELGSPFVPNVFVDVEGDPMRRKLAALECYGDEIPPAPHPRSLEAVKALAVTRGASVGLHAAEAFVLLREVL